MPLDKEGFKIQLDAYTTKVDNSPHRVVSGTTLKGMLTEVVDFTQEGGEQVYVALNKKPRAAIVSVEDGRVLELIRRELSQAEFQQLRKKANEQSLRGKNIK